MNIIKVFGQLLFVSIIILLFSSCNKGFKGNDYSAYFGGEIINPTHRYVLFCKDSEVLDTIALQKNNTFFIKFDSLASGLYTFRYDPEFQYVYFDKNDSLMVRINPKDFDESIVFCGRGDQKNNFLMEMYLKNETDKNKMLPIFDYEIDKFSATIDSSYKLDEQFYLTKKKKIKWNEAFDAYARALIDFHYYSKKEIYPKIHKLQTGEDNFDKLPKNYYDYRKNIDFNNVKLTTFSPFVVYLTNLLNNLAEIKDHNHYNAIDKALNSNINKLNIADTLLKNERVKNAVFNTIAFNYLLEDQNMVNDQAFLETYRKYSTDKSAKNEILKIGHAIQLLKPGNKLPEVKLIDLNGQIVSSNSLLKKKTVIFFYTENAETNLASAHKKAIAFKLRHPDYQFIAINLDANQTKWKELLSKYKFGDIQEYRCNNFENLRAKWAITKINRTIILNKNEIINNAFANLFETNFEDFLK
ncbi:MULTISPECIES: TlpA family protein disulfide reductase [unclassified Flavobacterium]|jgi:peroxiredoxin|uniref:TlpA family protein disulfide reductase n=1 Tax=unclassified Flavobacterium TaxID=196869 RepID=UPI0025C26019|nr:MULTISPECIES: hypothetical protein [unclassified Flavobacterium]